MKKILLLSIAIIAMTAVSVAQNPKTNPQPTKAKTAAVADTVKKAITIEELSQKLDAFVESQQKANTAMAKQIKIANARSSQPEERSSYRSLLREALPFAIFFIIGGSIVWIVYISSMMKFRNNQLRYDTILKCTQTTGSVPEHFSKMEQRRSTAVPVAGRVHLMVSMFCLFIGLLFVASAFGSNRGEVALTFFSLLFIAAAIVLYIKFSRVSENSRKREE